MFKQSSKILLVCLMAILSFNSAVEAERKGHARIVGGQIITIDKTPYIVRLEDRLGHLCGGTLVGPRHVVTAAHCVAHRKPQEFIVVGGSSKLSVKGEERKVVKIHTHSDYDHSIINMDAAVLELDADMTSTKVMKLCSNDIKAGDAVQVSGWGLTHEGGSKPSEDLRTIRVPVVAQNECYKQYKEGDTTITENMFCASQAGTKDSCTMDSGGPAIINNELCGIVSFGVGCARVNFPGVYVNVNKVLDFINNAMTL